MEAIDSRNVRLLYGAMLKRIVERERRDTSSEVRGAPNVPLAGRKIRVHGASQRNTLAIRYFMQKLTGVQPERVESTKDDAGVYLVFASAEVELEAINGILRQGGEQGLYLNNSWCPIIIDHTPTAVSLSTDPQAARISIVGAQLEEKQSVIFSVYNTTGVRPVDLQLVLTSVGGGAGGAAAFRSPRQVAREQPRYVKGVGLLFQTKEEEDSCIEALNSQYLAVLWVNGSPREVQVDNKSTVVEEGSISREVLEKTDLVVEQLLHGLPAPPVKSLSTNIDATQLEAWLEEQSRVNTEVQKLKTENAVLRRTLGFTEANIPDGMQATEYDVNSTLLKQLQTKETQLATLERTVVDLRAAAHHNQLSPKSEVTDDDEKLQLLEKSYERQQELELQLVTCKTQNKALQNALDKVNGLLEKATAEQKRQMGKRNELTKKLEGAETELESHIKKEEELHKKMTDSTLMKQLLKSNDTLDSLQLDLKRTQDQLAYSRDRSRDLEHQLADLRNEKEKQLVEVTQTKAKYTEYQKELQEAERASTLGYIKQLEAKETEIHALKQQLESELVDKDTEIKIVLQQKVKEIQEWKTKYSKYQQEVTEQERLNSMEFNRLVDEKERQIKEAKTKAATAMRQLAEIEMSMKHEEGRVPTTKQLFDNEVREKDNNQFTAEPLSRYTPPTTTTTTMVSDSTKQLLELKVQQLEEAQLRISEVENQLAERDISIQSLIAQMEATDKQLQEMQTCMESRVPTADLDAIVNSKNKALDEATTKAEQLQLELEKTNRVLEEKHHKLTELGRRLDESNVRKLNAESQMKSTLDKLVESAKTSIDLEAPSEDDDDTIRISEDDEQSQSDMPPTTPSQQTTVAFQEADICTVLSPESIKKAQLVQQQIMHQQPVVQQSPSLPMTSPVLALHPPLGHMPPPNVRVSSSLPQKLEIELNSIQITRSKLAEAVLWDTSAPTLLTEMEPILSNITLLGQQQTDVLQQLGESQSKLYDYNYTPPEYRLPPEVVSILHLYTMESNIPSFLTHTLQEEEERLESKLNTSPLAQKESNTPPADFPRASIHPLLHSLQTSLAYLPAYDGFAYRCMPTVLPQELDKWIAVGSTITFPAFTSATVNPANLPNYLSTQPASLFVFRSFTARQMHAVSCYPDDEEVVFGMNTQFRVVAARSADKLSPDDMRGFPVELHNGVIVYDLLEVNLRTGKGVLEALNTTERIELYSLSNVLHMYGQYPLPNIDEIILLNNTITADAEVQKSQHQMEADLPSLVGVAPLIHLSSAASDSNLMVADLLIASGVNPYLLDTKGNTAIMTAVRYSGTQEATSVIHRLGTLWEIDVNHTSAETGVTALQIAAEIGNSAVTAVLLSLGARLSGTWWLTRVGPQTSAQLLHSRQFRNMEPSSTNENVRKAILHTNTGNHEEALACMKLLLSTPVKSAGPKKVHQAKVHIKEDSEPTEGVMCNEMVQLVYGWVLKETDRLFQAKELLAQTFFGQGDTPRLQRTAEACATDATTSGKSEPAASPTVSPTIVSPRAPIISTQQLRWKDYVTVHMLVASIDCRIGDYKSLEYHIEEMRDIVVQHTDRWSLEMAEVYQVAAENSLHIGDYENAVHSLQEALFVMCLNHSIPPVYNYAQALTAPRQTLDTWETVSINRIWVDLAQAFNETGRYADAATCLQQVERNVGSDVTESTQLKSLEINMCITFAEVLLNQHKYTLALEYAMKGWHVATQYWSKERILPIVGLVIGQSHVHLGQYEEGMKWFQECRQQPNKHNSVAKSYLHTAECLLLKNDLAAAMDNVDVAIHECLPPLLATCYTVKGHILFANGEIGEARGQYEQAIKSSCVPKGQLWSCIANCCLRLGNPVEAEEKYTTAIRLLSGDDNQPPHPYLIPIYENLATILQEKNDMQGALQCHQERLRGCLYTYEPEDCLDLFLSCYGDMAKGCIQLGNYSNAMLYIDCALDLASDIRLQVLLTHCQLLLNSTDDDEIPDLDLWKNEADKDTITQHCLQLLDDCLRGTDNPIIVTNVNALLDILTIGWHMDNPVLADVFEAVGTHYLGTKQYKEALQAFTELLRLRKIEHDGNKHVSIGIAYMKMGEALCGEGRAAESLQYCTQGTVVFFDCDVDQLGMSYSYRILGLVRQKMGNYEMALENYEKYLEYIHEVFQDDVNYDSSMPELQYSPSNGGSYKFVAERKSSLGEKDDTDTLNTPIKAGQQKHLLSSRPAKAHQNTSIETQVSVHNAMAECYQALRQPEKAAESRRLAQSKVQTLMEEVIQTARSKSPPLKFQPSVGSTGESEAID